MKRFAPLAGALVSALLLTACMTADENAAFTAVNRDRSTAGVRVLMPNEQLVIKAQQWAKHLLDTSGDTCGLTTLHHSDLYAGAPAGAKAIGENVGCIFVLGSPTDAVAQLETAFMNSQFHRDNILDTRYNVGAVGMAWKQLGKNFYLVYETQEFAQM